MRVVMRYGKSGLPINFPDGLEVDVIQKKIMPVLAEPAEEVKAALLKPLGCNSLKEEVSGKKDICILICDNTRPVPHAILLPVLIRELINVGADPSAITILVATGLHRPNEGKELKELIGSDWVLQNIRAVNHFARNDEDHIFLGTTSRGIPLKLDRRFVDADMRIAVGLVEPHFMAGYSGGRKLIVPGVAHHETIRVLHSTRMLLHEKVTNCVIERNPLHEEMMEAVRMVGRCFALNTVIDEDRNISFVNFGEIVESHLAAVSFARPYFEIPVQRRYRTIVTSSAGHPLDRNYYQTTKGMVSVSDILEPGGNILIVSKCSEGLGTMEFIESQSRMIKIGAERLMQETSKKQYASIDEWGSIMQIKVMNAGKIHLYSEGLSEEEQRLTGVNMIKSIEEAIVRSVKEKNDAHIAVIPEGPYVIPIYNPNNAC